MFKKVMGIAAVALLVFIAGCSKAPQTEIQNADQAISMANESEATQYAPEAFQIAMDTLNAAKAAVKEQDGKFALFRSYGKSKEMFVAAERLTQDAITQAQTEKERVKAEVSTLLSQVGTALNEANTALAKAPKGKGSAADLQLMKADLESAKSGLTEAQADFDNGKYLVAQSKLEAVSESINKVSGEIQAAINKKKGR
jgi:protein involved in sex pheromone biosynthesis